MKKGVIFAIIFIVVVGIILIIAFQGGGEQNSLNFNNDTNDIDKSSNQNINTAGTNFCPYIYKVSDYLEYGWGYAKGDGSIEWFRSLGFNKLEKGYFYGGSNCEIKPEEFLVLNILRSDLNMTFGEGGCQTLLRNKYPQCYALGGVGEMVGQNLEECKPIINENPSECKNIKITKTNVLTKVPFEEYYDCTGQSLISNKEINEFILSGGLEKECNRLV
jgi:hypothetical protein